MSQRLFAFISLAPVASIAASAAVSLLIAMSARWHLRFSGDLPSSGVQKIHVHKTPRVGGLAIILGVLVYLLAQPASGIPHAAGSSITGFGLLLFAVPVFLIGLIEDFTQAVRPVIRLLVVAMAVVWMAVEAGIVIRQTDLTILDFLLKHYWLAIAFTAFAVVGFSHAINIVDGLNGLASGTGLVMFAGLAWLAQSAGSPFIADLAIAGICGLLGFALLNFPRGHLFMGDGGAYFTGFWIAVCAVLLVMFPGISAWKVLAACAYPVIETLFSMVRRITHRRPLAAPDRLHLHSLLYLRVFLPTARRRELAPWHAHAMTSGVLVLANVVFVVAAAGFGVAPASGMLVFAAEIAVYVIFYRRLVRFRWL